MMQHIAQMHARMQALESGVDARVREIETIVHTRLNKNETNEDTEKDDLCVGPPESSCDLFDAIAEMQDLDNEGEYIGEVEPQKELISAGVGLGAGVVNTLMLMAQSTESDDLTDSQMRKITAAVSLLDPPHTTRKLAFAYALMRSLIREYSLEEKASGEVPEDIPAAKASGAAQPADFLEYLKKAAITCRDVVVLHVAYACNDDVCSSAYFYNCLQQACGGLQPPTEVWSALNNAFQTVRKIGSRDRDSKFNKNCCHKLREPQRRTLFNAYVAAAHKMSPPGLEVRAGTPPNSVPAALDLPSSSAPSS